MPGVWGAVCVHPPQEDQPLLRWRPLRQAHRDLSAGPGVGLLDQDVSFHIRVTGNQRSAVICEALSGCSAENKVAVDRGGTEDLFRGYCRSSSKK